MGISKEEFTANEAILKELECPICLDILENAVFSTKCFHRFCEACINGIHECPYCKVNIATTIVEDRNSRNLIQILRDLGDNPESETSSSQNQLAEQTENEIFLDVLSQLTLNTTEQTEIKELYDTLQVKLNGA